MITKKTEEVLRRQHYGIAGKNSAVQICRWAKKSLLDEGHCYKQQFYGISSHRCCQMSPSVAWCQNKCMHCWRAVEYTLGDKLKKSEVDEPKKIIEDCIKEQRILLSGFKGNPRANEKKLKEALEPNQFAISLAGEPTIYPLIGELISELRKSRKTSFLVTNGLLPSRIKEMNEKGQLPTQLYVSLNAPNEKLYKEIVRSNLKDAWKKFNETLTLLHKIETRRVLRMTLVRDLNMIEAENYSKLIKRANPDFVEVKGFMSVGFSRKRLGYERMPLHSEVKEFAERISSLAGLKLLDEKVESRVVVLGKNKEELNIKGV